MSGWVQHVLEVFPVDRDYGLDVGVKDERGVNNCCQFLRLTTGWILVSFMEKGKTKKSEYWADD